MRTVKRRDFLVTRTATTTSLVPNSIVEDRQLRINLQWVSLTWEDLRNQGANGSAKLCTFFNVLLDAAS